MKNALDFDIRFSGLRETDFINCFASAIMFLEDGGKASGNDVPCKNGHNVCSGCGVGCNDSPASRQARWFFLFDTMSGVSCIRRRYGGEPSEMMKALGDGATDSPENDCTYDFLFGFSGYDYRKLAEPGAFKTAIVQSIDAGKPVLAKVKTHFHVIIGYDGDTLLCPDYANAQSRPSAPEYSEIETLYIIGDKGAPRYTLKDGLDRVRQMMELNAQEKIWDGYLEKAWDVILPSDDEFKKLSPEQQKSFMAELTAAAWMAWTSHNLGQAFASRHHDEMRNPKFAELWAKITERCNRSCEVGHAINYLNGKIDWSELHASLRSGLGGMLLMMIERYKALDAELLDLVKQAIMMMDKK